MTAAVQVVIADDSRLARLVMNRVLQELPSFEVTGMARNGWEAVEKTHELRPDLLLLDRDMPSYDGLYAIKRLMAEYPVPILLLSSFSELDFDPVRQALDAGAVDYINKPRGLQAAGKPFKELLASKAMQVAEVNLNRVRELKAVQTVENHNPHTFPRRQGYSVIVIGASAGGVEAIEKVLKRMPVNFPIPIVIALHMPANFTASFVQNLNTKLPLPIKEMELNEELQAGKIYFAGSKRSLILRRHQRSGSVVVGYQRHASSQHNPSIDQLFQSAADLFGKRALGVLLSGSGTDGIQGMEAIHQRGGATVIQDSQSALMWGAAGEVARRNIAQHVVPVEQLGGFLVSCLS